MLTRLFIFLIFTSLFQAGSLLKPQEVVIFSFKTASGKQLMLAKEKNDRYIVYRFGKNDKVELEFPKNKAESWSQFEYSFYLRPPQQEVEGHDENYVVFTIGKFQYTIFEKMVTADKVQTDIGIEVKNLSTGTVTTIAGVNSSQRGTLIDLRSSEIRQVDR